MAIGKGAQVRRRATAGNRRGFVLITSYLAVAVFLVLQAAYTTRVVTDHKLAQRYVARLHALTMSEAGVDAAIGELRYLAGYDGAELTLLGAGQYASVVAPTGHIDTSALFRKQEVRIESQGAYPNTTPALATRAVTAVTLQEVNPFSYALFSEYTIHASGTLWTRCVDSRTGPVVPPVPSGAPCGYVGSDTMGPGTISIGGSLEADGTTYTCGVGCDPSADITFVFPPVPSVDTAAREEAKVTSTPSTPLPPSEGTLTIAPWATYVLTPGVHRFDRISIGTGGTLTASGPVTIFLIPPPGVAPLALSLGSSIMASGSVPTNLRLHAYVPMGLLAPATFSGVLLVGGFEWVGASPVIRFVSSTIIGSYISAGPVETSGVTKFFYDFAFSGLPVASSSRRPYEFFVTQTGWKGQ